MDKWPDVEGCTFAFEKRNTKRITKSKDKKRLYKI